eukprot:TRINITY_DN6992_c0_g3_i3.p1 TRINITY_DN6992_c0_g3~~TRINITY_DN6992_c0_g3_i3.p1  ORF type:complete len:535 (+),score=182.19 TRINITY_DN6992_c0_g3_i3:63-1667(+)
MGFVDWFRSLPRSRQVPVALVLLLLGKSLYNWLVRRLLNRPPQPFALPILGNMHLLPPPGQLPGVHKALTKMAEKHGPVMGLWFGSQYTVVLSNWQAAHDALKTHGDAFAGRFCPDSIRIITKGRGIALQNDLEKWRKARTALLRGMTMKRMGEKTVPVVLEEIRSTGHGLRVLCEQNGGSYTTSLRGHIGRESLNVYMRQMCSVRFSDKLTQTYEDVRQCLEEIFKRISAGNPGDYMPLVKVLAGKPKVLTEMEYWSDRMYSYIRRWIAEHKSTLDPAAPRDFLDEMLINKAEYGIDDTDIEVIVWDVMAGGIDTTSTTLEWLLYILCNYPETQRKVQEELEREVGPGRLPSYEDRDRLPYLNAVILELMRWKHFAPFGLPHQTLEDTQCLGFNIPKNTQVIINFHAAGRDKSAWKNPDEWRPERWLEEEKDLQHSFLDGEVKNTAKAYKIIPFGAGKRMCVGYGLGRIVMWCKVATHLHCFDFESGTGGKLNIEDEHFGVTVVPNEQPVKITPRPAAYLLESVEQTYGGCTL